MLVYTNTKKQASSMTFSISSIDLEDSSCLNYHAHGEACVEQVKSINIKIPNYEIHDFSINATGLCFNCN